MHNLNIMLCRYYWSLSEIVKVYYIFLGIKPCAVDIQPCTEIHD